MPSGCQALQPVSTLGCRVSSPLDLPTAVWPALVTRTLTFDHSHPCRLNTVRWHRLAQSTGCVMPWLSMLQNT